VRRTKLEAARAIGAARVTSNSSSVLTKWRRKLGIQGNNRLIRPSEAALPESDG
jgi:hypothetical protein